MWGQKKRQYAMNLAGFPAGRVRAGLSEPEPALLRIPLLQTCLSEREHAQLRLPFLQKRAGVTPDETKADETKLSGSVDIDTPAPRIRLQSNRSSRGWSLDGTHDPFLRQRERRPRTFSSEGQSKATPLSKRPSFKIMTRVARFRHGTRRLMFGKYTDPVVEAMYQTWHIESSLPKVCHALAAAIHGWKPLAQNASRFCSVHPFDTLGQLLVLLGLCPCLPATP